MEAIRPNSISSNSSFHSTHDEFEPVTPISSITQVEREEVSGGVSVRRDKEESNEMSKEEVRLLRQALESVQVKLHETRKENCLLQAQLKPETVGERDGIVREKRKEEELMKSLAELQAKQIDTQERYHQAVEEVEELKAQIIREGGEQIEKEENQACTAATQENEVKQLKAQLIHSGCKQEKAAQQIRYLENAVRMAEEERRSMNEKEQKIMQMEELYKDAQEEIRMLQVDMDLFPFV